ncbi:ABC transporter ATP-binding protein/permease [Tissierella sp. MSJ-40]|uniref:ABC transporter ATP-binding protein/permease n=1 Tax=Tissierella simiarum TaxID=2841534 RepID=A0ABS6E861_9FIRM|nr:ABC transporter ATP-binding protein [Tissierella simiarum]MBU5438428.1 ABC transporter ATP-binding protein/permease [Tissierella simiarum]
MNQEIYSFNLKDAIKSLKSFPKVFKLLWSVRKLHLILITIFYIINGILPAISILTTQSLLNAIQTSRGKDFIYVLYPLIIYLSLNSFGYIISQLNSYLQSIFRIDLNYKMSVMILEKARTLSLSDFENSEVYDKLRRAQSEAVERPYAVFSIVLSIVSQFLGLISSLAILLYWKPWIILLVIIMPIISTIYMAKMGHMQYKIEYERSQEKRKSWYLSYLMTNDIAFKEIKIYRLGDYLIKGYKKLNKNFIKQDKKIIKKTTIASFIFEVLDQIVGGFILYLIIQSAYIGEILLGNTVAYIRSLSNIKGNMQGLLGSVSAIYQNNLYIKQLFDFLEMPVKEEKSSISIEEIKTIEFINVSFKYPNRQEYALKDISFKIKKGENLSLVGENGSGKSTLVKLLSGFYDNYEGEILINGISMRQINQENLGNKIGIIFQDFNKYELTCRENIALGNIDLINQDDKLQAAINKAHANEMVNSLPNGIETQLGVWFSEGVQLSGGQWQRIALSRAFLRDADCYILDEPSASLDPVSEHEIFQKTSDLTKDKISIFISHRLYNLRKISSKVLVLKEGKLIEQGTHEELMDLNGHYKYLYNLQNTIDLVDDIESIA